MESTRFISRLLHTCLVLLLLMPVSGKSQEKLDSISFEYVETHLREALEQLIRQYGLEICYLDEDIKVIKITVSCDNCTIDEALNAIVEDTQLFWERKPESPIALRKKMNRNGSIYGRVIDKDSQEPLPGANVFLKTIDFKDTKYGNSTDIKGYFNIQDIRPDEYILIVRYIGYRPDSAIVDITSTAVDTMNIQLTMEPVPGDTIIKEPDEWDQIDYNLIVKTPGNLVKILESTYSGVTSVPSSGGGESGEAMILIRNIPFGVRHTLDGFYAGDPFTGGIGIRIPKMAIQRVELRTKNFSAEFKEMNGGIDVVTKDGDSTSALVIRPIIVGFSNKPSHQFQGSIGGPVFGADSKLRYIGAIEHSQTDGYRNVLQDDVVWNVIAKLTYLPSKENKFSLIAIGYSKDQQFNNYRFAREGIYLPQLEAEIHDNNLIGNNRMSTRAQQVMAHWRQKLTENVRIDLKTQYFIRRFIDRVHIDPDDYSFTSSNESENFGISRDNLRFLEQEARFLQSRLDLGWVKNQKYLLKTGIEISYYRIWRKLLAKYDVKLRVDQYHFRPVEASAYIQHAIDYRQFNLSIGFRLAYFSGFSWEDHDDPLVKKSLVLSKLLYSPRIELARSLGDSAEAYISSGIFYPLPRGVSALPPPKNFGYEVGWKKRFAGFLSLRIAGFYKIFENPSNTGIYSFPKTSSATHPVNLDFIKSRGLEVNLHIQRYEHLTSYFSYTFSRTENNSLNSLDTKDELLLYPQNTPRKKTVVGYWDRPHVLNFNLDFRYGKNEGPKFGGSYWLENFNINLTGRFRSGFPFTLTDSSGQQVGIENAERRPFTWQLDLRAEKMFEIGKLKLSVFTEILNLTNRRNVLEVFTDTGLPHETTKPGFSPEGKLNPYHIGPQRNIRIGLQFEM